MKCTYSDCLKIIHINNFSLGYPSCKILHCADIILMLHKKDKPTSFMSVFRQQYNFIFIFSTFQINAPHNYTFFLKVDHTNCIMLFRPSLFKFSVLMLLSYIKCVCIRGDYQLSITVYIRKIASILPFLFKAVFRLNLINIADVQHKPTQLQQHMKIGQRSAAQGWNPRTVLPVLQPLPQMKSKQFQI